MILITIAISLAMSWAGVKDRLDIAQILAIAATVSLNYI